MAVYLSLFSAGRARADDARTKALEHFDRGRALYQVSEYREALTEFKQAFLIKEDPVFIFNIAQCHRLLEEARPAITFYRRYLSAAPDAPNRAQAQKFIDDLEVSIAKTGGGRGSPAPSPLPPPPIAPMVPAPSVPSTSQGTPPLHSPMLRAPPSSQLPVDVQPGDGGKAGEPLYRRWWFWAGATGLVAGAVLSAVMLSSGDRRATSCGPGVDSCAPVRQ